MSHRRQVLALAGWLLALAAAIAGLQLAGHGSLATPPLRSWAQLSAWATHRAPETTVFAVLRLVALGLAWYLLATSFLAAAGQLLQLRALVRAVEPFTLRTVRRLVTGAVGVSLLAAPMVAAGSASAANAVPSAAVSPGNTGDPTPVMRVLPAAAGAGQDLTQAVPWTPAPLAVSTPSRAWTVRPGDDFWSVASSELGQSWGRPPTDLEVVPYWQTLIAANRAVLADPDNPNLLFPGQTLALPPPPLVPANR